MSFRYPLMSAQTSAAIYYQAWKLWWKKCPFYTHPKNETNRTACPPPVSGVTPGATSTR